MTGFGLQTSDFACSTNDPKKLISSSSYYLELLMMALPKNY